MHWRGLSCLAVVFAGLVLLSADPPAEAQPAVKGKKYALLVGVRSYRHSHFTELQFAENDVEELGKLLLAPQAGFTEVVLLTSSRGEKKASAAPTAGNLRKELKRLLD